MTQSSQHDQVEIHALSIKVAHGSLTIKPIGRKAVTMTFSDFGLNIECNAFQNVTKIIGNGAEWAVKHMPENSVVFVVDEFGSTICFVRTTGKAQLTDTYINAEGDADYQLIGAWISEYLEEHDFQKVGIIVETSSDVHQVVANNSITRKDSIMNNTDINANRNVDLMCHYIAYMDCKRRVIMEGGIGKMTVDIPYIGRGDKATVESIKTIIAPLLHFYGFIMMMESRKDFIVISGFMAYKGNVVRLDENQVEKVMNNVFGMETEENDKFIKSPCSISDFSTIKEDVLQDEDIIEKELL